MSATFHRAAAIALVGPVDVYARPLLRIVPNIRDGGGTVDVPRLRSSGPVVNVGIWRIHNPIVEKKEHGQT